MHNNKKMKSYYQMIILYSNIHIFISKGKSQNIWKFSFFIIRISSILKTDLKEVKKKKKIKREKKLKMKKKRKIKKKKKVLWWSLLSKKLISRVKVSQLGIYRCVSGPVTWELASWALSFISFTCWFFFSSLWYWGLPGGTLGWWRWPQGREVASCLSSFRPSL